jgi:hypothetical protein
VSATVGPVGRHPDRVACLLQIDPIALPLTPTRRARLAPPTPYGIKQADPGIPTMCPSRPDE